MAIAKHCNLRPPDGKSFCAL